MLSGKLERLSSFLLSLFETRSPLESESCSVMSWLFPTPLYSPWNSPGQKTGVSSLSLLLGIFPTREDLQHCRWILYQLSHKGSPRILEWVAYPFSSGSSRPRNWTGVSCIAGGFFTNWPMREFQNRVAQSCPALCDSVDLHSPWNSPGQKSTIET